MTNVLILLVNAKAWLEELNITEDFYSTLPNSGNIRLANQPKECEEVN